DHVGVAVPDALDRAVHVAGFAHDLELLAEFRAQAGEEEVVVVDEEHAGPPGRLAGVPWWGTGTARAHALSRGIVRVTPVPPPGRLVTTALPPWRRMRPRIDSAMPRRSSGTSAGSKPLPWSRTNAVIASGSTST